MGKREGEVKGKERRRWRRPRSTDHTGDGSPKSKREKCRGRRHLRRPCHITPESKNNVDRQQDGTLEQISNHVISVQFAIPFSLYASIHFDTRRRSGIKSILIVGVSQIKVNFLLQSATSNFSQLYLLNSVAPLDWSLHRLSIRVPPKFRFNNNEKHNHVNCPKAFMIIKCLRQTKKASSPLSVSLQHLFF